MWIMGSEVKCGVFAIINKDFLFFPQKVIP